MSKKSLSISTSSPLFYHKRPVFGLDIGSQNIKVMQLSVGRKKAAVVAYGNTDTNQKLMNAGVVTDVKAAAQQIDALLSTGLKGRLTTNRVVMSIPIAHVFTRVLSLPQMSKKEILSAIELEIEQSVPVPAKELYFDFESTPSEDSGDLMVRMVAAPRAIVDSFVEVCALLKFDLCLIQTNIDADAQLCMLYEEIERGRPYIIIDIGGTSIDVGILDTTLRVTGTIDQGGENLTDAVAKTLGISRPKAQEIKVAEGLNAGPHQLQMKQAVSPILNKLVTEITRIKKFYIDRINPNDQIAQIVITGGGANMPGLGDYITNATRISARVVSPWTNHISFGKLEPPAHEDLPRFLTAAGLALTKQGAEVEE